MRLRRLFFTLCAGAAIAASAAPYSGNGPGSSVIDAGGTGDYLSLADATAAVNAGPALTGGDWTFLIRSDLTETSNSALGQNTNGFRITLRPDTGSSVTVTFASISGRAHLAVGTTNTVANSLDLVKTDNVVIDGSNNGTQSRNLTLLHGPALSDPLPMIQVVGNSDGVQVRNCTIVTDIPYHSDVIYPLMPSIEFASYFAPLQDLTNEYPDDGLVENNDIHARSYHTAAGVASTQKNFSSSAELTEAQTGLVVRGNTISACLAGIYLDSTRGAEVSANTIALDQPGNRSCIGILAGRGGTGSTLLDVSIFNNHITQLHGRVAPGWFVAGIAAGNSSTGFTYRIYNNMISNVQAKAVSSTAPGAMSGITLAGSLSVTANVWHNSIHIPPPPAGRASSFASGTQVAGISIPGTPVALRTTHARLKNNIICNEETTGSLIYRAAAGTITSDHNAFFLANGSDSDLEQWQTQSGQDSNSTYASPLTPHAPATGMWTSTTDLHFTSGPGAPFAGTAVSGVSLDIDGEPRSASAPTKGADEVSAPAAAMDWELFGND